jgi:hypothetical protein
MLSEKIYRKAAKVAKERGGGRVIGYLLSVIGEARRGSFFMWLEHLAPGRPWSVPLQVLRSQRRSHFFTFMIIS